MNLYPKEVENWEVYLSDLHKYLTSKDFKKYNQKLVGEDFAYWKSYFDIYQIGILVYDFRKYGGDIRLSFVCMPLNIEGRCDLTVSMEIELEDFEKMAKVFYDSMSPFLKIT